MSYKATYDFDQFQEAGEGADGFDVECQTHFDSLSSHFYHCTSPQLCGVCVVVFAALPSRYL